MKRKHIIRLFIYPLVTIFLYIYIFGFLAFAFVKPSDTNFQTNHSVDRFFNDTHGTDRVVLIDERKDAIFSRLDLIQNAQKQIDAAYFQIANDYTSDVFFASLIEAAERGVQVRLLIDGMLSTTQPLKAQMMALLTHENIQVKYYEPFNFLKPWTINNRMHDKLILVDETYLLLGGRNIDERFFASEDYDGLITNDHDVLVIKTNQDELDSAVMEGLDYYNELWDHPYTVVPYSRQRKTANQQAIKALKQMKRTKQNLELEYPEINNLSINWLEKSFPTNKVSFIHNPIERGNKEPWVWYDVSRLMNQAQSSVFIQSPYLIPTKKMLSHLDLEHLRSIDTTFFTNSIKSNPNFFGSLAYRKNRTFLVDQLFKIYEYQGPESIHGKSIQIDERLTLIGSFNFDARSTYLSTEIMVVIDSVDFSTHYKDEMIDKYAHNSYLVSSDYGYVEQDYPKRSKGIEWFYDLLGLLVRTHDFLI